MNKLFLSEMEYLKDIFNKIYYNIKVMMYKITIRLFEQNKIKKTKSILLGILDFAINKYGKYNG